MPSVRFLATYDGRGAVRLPATNLAPDQTTLQGLTNVFLEHTGLDAFVLHSGSLEPNAAQASYTVRLELAAPSAALSTAYPQLPRARAWQQPGWFRETLTGLETTLEEAVTGLEGVSTNDLGAVLRIRTASRTAYLKTSEQGLEATLSAHITKSHPGLTPAVLALDASRNLLLTRDCGARLSETADIALWQRAVVNLAHFQRTADAATLHGHGAPTHAFGDLAERAARFLQDSTALRNWGLNTGQRAALSARLPRIVQAHERVRRLELPLTPSHGDAHPMNALTGCGVVWFDWSEVSVAHPLLDIGWFLAWLSHPGRVALPLRQRHPEAARLLGQTYLQAAAMLEPDIPMTDTMLLALTHRALVYHERFFAWQGTVPGSRPKHVPFLLRSLLSLPL